MKTLPEPRNHHRHPLSRLILTACTAGLCASAMAAPGDNTLEKRFWDGWVEGKVETIYLLNPHLNSFKIDAEANGDTLTLSGEVDEDIDRDLAEAIAKGIDGIKTVHNQIAVVPQKPASDEPGNKPTLSQHIHDITTSTMIKGKFLKSPHIAGFDIDVDTVNGHVTLNGEVDSSAAKDLAWRLAKNTDGVVEVKNNLKVKPKGADKQNS